jgi:hypothetical protein
MKDNCRANPAPPASPGFQLWHSLVPRALTAKDEREIHANLVGFFRLLIEWDGCGARRTLGDPAGCREVTRTFRWSY